MKVLADRHHTELYHSLIMLFEGRMGFDLFRPIGEEWWSEGFWSVYNHPETVKQYLGIGLAVPEGAREDARLNTGASEIDSGLYRIGEERGIRLDAAKDMQFDILISSMPDHFRAYERLRQAYCPNAKHIFQMGNMWVVPAGVRNLLNSTAVPPPPGVNHVRYHQEFDLSRFAPQPCDNPRRMINLMHYQSGHCPGEFKMLASHLKARGWTVLDHGAGNADGPTDDVPATLRDAGFLWHNKRGGEGFGFCIHQATAAGRPIVCFRSLYKGMTADALLEDGVSCINLDGTPLARAADRMETIVASGQYDALSASTAARFRSVVDFDREAEEIKRFLGRLQ